MSFSLERVDSHGSMVQCSLPGMASRSFSNVVLYGLLTLCSLPGFLQPSFELLHHSCDGGDQTLPYFFGSLSIIACI